MAKNKETKEKKGKGGFGSFIMIFLIILIWLAILALLVKNDVGGVGSMLRPYIKDVKYLNAILPEVSIEQQAYENGYPYKTAEEMMNRIKFLEEQVDKLTEENNDYAERQKEMQTELDALRHYEEEYEAFLKIKKDFDRNVVYADNAPSTEEYVKYYAQMYPETAAEIYKELLRQTAIDETVENQAAYFAKMKAAQAAEILSEMTSDIDLVCNILRCMKTQAVSDILSKMDTLYAARIVNRMHEMDEELLTE
ncbi:MAG: hypothetical protein K6B75_06940 [Lachnospiraceae bacterium]|nr:hypothetical protein [Lachnospiraceae bacterium]